jgi:Na+-transporting NADH:ubiquinone oxidoreductase subunit B
MKPLRRFLDSLEPTFKEGKLKPLYPLYEAVDTFLYTPPDVTAGPTHVRDGMDIKRMMMTVVVALGPCIVMAMYNTGLQANRVLQQQVQSGAIDRRAARDWLAGRGAGQNAVRLRSDLRVGQHPAWGDVLHPGLSGHADRRRIV